jgi:hypothetical protein
MSDDDIDPFAQVALDQISNPVRSRMRAAQTRAECALAKKQSDEEILHQQWQDWHDTQLKKLMTGRHRKAAQTLSAFLERMDVEDGEELISLVSSWSWPNVDSDTKFVVLGLISRRIIYLREAHGLAPFDDSIPFSDEPPTVFEIIRGLVGDDDG